MTNAPGGVLVLKLGGELVDTAEARARVALAIASLARTRPVLVVHGGGRAIDVELARRGVTPVKVDGLRVTDADTLETVVAVLAGSANTALVAALVAAGVRAVGLTGVDAACGRATRSRPLQSTSGALVDLGLVGDPAEADPTLFELLMTNGYVPVVASVGIECASQEPPTEVRSALRTDARSALRTDARSALRTTDGPHAGTPSVLNINADVMACRIAAALGARELVIAGTTAGVLDDDGAAFAQLDADQMDALIAGGTASAGMVAKLRACLSALEDGVASVRIVDGRSLTGDLGAAPGTTLTLACAEYAGGSR